MTENMKIIGIYPENCEFESDYLPLISFKTQQQKDKAEKYILNKVRIFFNKIIKIEMDVEKSQITYSKVITEKDFNAKPISYFYENLFFDLGKRTSGKKLDYCPKWGITFDEKCAPILISYLSSGYTIHPPDHPEYKKPNYSLLRSPKTDDGFPYYRYGTIDINCKPVFYYIYFSLQEILDAIKKPTNL